MPVTIEDAPAADEAIAAAPQPVGPVSVPVTIKIKGVEREAVQTTIGEKVIVHTKRLSVIEQRLISRASHPQDEGKVAGLLNYVAATVRFIDGRPIGFPATDGQIEAILAQLGDDVAEHLTKLLSENAGTVAAEAKN